MDKSRQMKSNGCHFAERPRATATRGWRREERTVVSASGEGGGGGLGSVCFSWFLYDGGAVEGGWEKGLLELSCRCPEG